MSLEQLIPRKLPDGGFSPALNTSYRVDANCWAIMAFSYISTNRDLLVMARNRLAADQHADGRVCLSPDHLEVIWPTSLAIFAWHQSPEHQKNQKNATDFLIASSGTYFHQSDDSSTNHDTSIKGWSWIADTHSWVEPTAMAMMALKLTGFDNHERVKEATRLLLDRQLSSGGWNYGNTTVFNQTLRPMPLSTGMALNALKDQTSMESVQHSITYLQNKLRDLKTPRSLAWSLLGLGAWNARNESTRSLIDACLKNQERFGIYDTESLSLLMIAEQSPGGLEGIFPDAVKS